MKKYADQFMAVFSKAVVAAGVYIGAAVLQSAATVLSSYAEDVCKNAAAQIKDVNKAADSVMKDAANN